VLLLLLVRLEVKRWGAESACRAEGTNGPCASRRALLERDKAAVAVRHERNCRCQRRAPLSRLLR
jgi:hypothetical protein